MFTKVITLKTSGTTEYVYFGVKKLALAGAIQKDMTLNV